MSIFSKLLLFALLFSSTSFAFDIKETKIADGAIWVTWQCEVFESYNFDYGIWNEQTNQWEWQTFFRIANVKYTLQYETFFPLNYIENKRIIFRVVKNNIEL